MTGPEHYKEAERLLEGRDTRGRDWTDAGWMSGVSNAFDRATLRQVQLTEAMIHMGLAQAAATVATARAGNGWLGWTGQDDALGEWGQAVTARG